MAVFLVAVAALCVAVSAAPPAQPRLYSNDQLQQINPLDYYIDNPYEANYYNHQQQQRQVSANSESNREPSRLETLDPDSEVELIPGAQTPQQPPQQPPVAPNVPGLVPGQRVFIVHMPVPGYRPGTIGGYQPVYVVAAAPEGFQTAGGQAMCYPFLGYNRPGIGVQQGNPNVFVGAPLTLNNRPYDLQYQAPVAYQPASPGAQGPEELVHLAQLMNLQGQSIHPGNESRPGNEIPTNPELKKANLESSATKEAEEPRRNARPAPPHANRNKA